jgi:predicted translin family RNA/ssDNA-binding protein
MEKSNTDVSNETKINRLTGLAIFHIHQNELDKANSALKRADEIKRGA